MGTSSMGRDFQGGAPHSMPDPAPLGLQKPTLPSTSQRRETLWAYGSHHFPRSGCTTCSIHPDVGTQPCPLSSLPARNHGLEHVTSTPASISYPLPTPKTHPYLPPPWPRPRPCPPLDRGHPSVLLLLGGLAADPPTHRPRRSPWLQAPRPPPTRVARWLCLRAGVPQGLVLGLGPSPQESSGLQ